MSDDRAIFDKRNIQDIVERAYLDWQERAALRRVFIPPPGSVVETSDKPFYIDAPLSERGFGA